MKLDYNILWIDDHIDEFISDGWLQKVSDHLNINGFEPKICPIPKFNDFSHFTGDFDLILTDYNLASYPTIEKNGDQIIKEIRNSNVSTEILFYTAHKLGDIGQINRITFLETHSLQDGHHKSVYNEIIKLIDLTIRKFQHIIVMRGMIMHETSLLDATKMNIINLCMSCIKLDTECISDKIFDAVSTHINEKFNKFEKYKQNKSIDKLMGDNVLFSSYQQAQAIGEVLKQLELDDFSTDYNDEITKTRNLFAHAVLCNDDKNDFFENKKENIVFNSEKCKEIRQNIRKHKENLEKLESKVREIS
ncbi:MAG: hypothetical protein LBU81_01755 [Methanosarcinales archaeon]|jgi:hypothetical protein|nr:hypothetical protein [Methanosarcinales archaeon]